MPRLSPEFLFARVLRLQSCPVQAWALATGYFFARIRYNLEEIPSIITFIAAAYLAVPASHPSFKPVRTRNKGSVKGIVMSLRQFSRLSTAFLVAAFLISCGNVAKQPASTDVPTVLMVVPQSDGVGTNREIAVVFNQPMDPASINASTFLIAGATGTVTYDATNKIGGFRPSPDLTANVMYNASITVGAKALSGTPLATPYDFLLHYTRNHRHFRPVRYSREPCRRRHLRTPGPEDRGHF